MDTQLALQLIDLCNQTYFAPQIQAGLDGRDGASIYTLPSGETVICPRGTLANGDFMSVLDWLQDFHADFVQADGFAGRVHAGFLNSLNALWMPLIEALEGKQEETEFVPDPEPPLWRRLRDWFAGPQPLPPLVEPPPLPWKKKLIIAGHSKAGALAQMMGVRLRHFRPHVVAFAPPMWTDVTGASNYPFVKDGGSVDLTIFIGDGDLVPHLPPLGYRTVPGLIIEEVPLSPNLKRPYLDRMVAEWRPEKIREAHSLTTYANWIRRLDTPPAKEEKAAA